MTFMLFAGQHYYPSGGWEDFAGHFASLEEAREAGQKPADERAYGFVNEWYHIVHNDKIVEAAFTKARTRAVPIKYEWQIRGF